MKKRIVSIVLGTVLAFNMTTGVFAEKKADSKVVIKNTVGDVETEEVFEEAPEKAVTLAGFTTQMMLALGLEDKIVGYGYMDNPVPEKYEKAFEGLTCLSEGNPSKENLLEVEPDFLTGWASTFSEKNFPIGFCEENDIKPYVPQVEYPPASMEKVCQDFENLGEIFHVEEKADEIVTDIQARLKKVEDAVEGKEEVSVFIYDSGEDAPLTASAGLPTDMIRLAGGKNIFEDTETNWMNVDWEDVIAKNPEYIIIMDYNGSDPIDSKIEFLKNNEALAGISAIENDHFFVMGLTDVTGCYESIDAVEKMAEEFHADCF